MNLIDPRCRHCQRHDGTIKARGLCSACYDNRAIRARYPPLPWRGASRIPGHNAGMPSMPHEVCRYHLRLMAWHRRRVRVRQELAEWERQHPRPVLAAEVGT